MYGRSLPGLLARATNSEFTVICLCTRNEHLKPVCRTIGLVQKFEIGLYDLLIFTLVSETAGKTWQKNRLWC